MSRPGMLASYWTDVLVTLIPAAFERVRWWGWPDREDGLEEREQAFLDAITDAR